MKRIVFRRTIFQFGRPPGRFAPTYDRPELPSPMHFLDTRAHRAKLQFSLAVEPLALSWPAFDGLPAALQTPAPLGHRRVDLDSRRHIAKRHGADPCLWSFTPQVDSAGHRSGSKDR